MSPHTVDAAAFRRFEHESWERVAPRYVSSWALVTQRYAGLLVAALQVMPGERFLDVACGPGYVAKAAQAAGAAAVGVDFSRAMVELARELSPGPDYEEGDAEELRFASASFDAAAMSFGILHLARPDRALAEARRVLRRGGRFGFTLWAGAEDCGVERIVSAAIKAHAEAVPGLPEGPAASLFCDPETCRRALSEAGFDAASMSFETHAVEWLVPSADFLFEAERWAGVRTAALLAGQAPKRLEAIRDAVRTSVARHRKPGGYALSMAAHVVTARAA